MADGGLLVGPLDLCCGPLAHSAASRRANTARSGTLLETPRVRPRHRVHLDNGRLLSVQQLGTQELNQPLTNPVIKTASSIDAARRLKRAANATD